MLDLQIKGPQIAQSQARHMLTHHGRRVGLVADEMDSSSGSELARRKNLRSQFYRAARDMGNVEAARMDPAAESFRWMIIQLL